MTITDDDFPTSQEILTNIANAIIAEGKFQNQFSKILKKYVVDICFGKTVDIEELNIRRSLSKSDTSKKIQLLISRALGEKTKVKTEMKVTNYPISLMELEPFLWKRKIVDLKHTVFNHTPVYNELEAAFAKFLDASPDIKRWAALAETFTKFSITYLNKRGGQGLYYPDFIAVQELKKNTFVHWIIETKGYEDENVQYKDAETKHWCENATKNTTQTWRFVKVSDDFFRGGNKANFKSFEDLIERMNRPTPEQKKIID